MTDTGQRGKRQVVIVGGGFAGLFAVRALRRSDVWVTMIGGSVVTASSSATTSSWWRPGSGSPISAMTSFPAGHQA